MTLLAEPLSPAAREADSRRAIPCRLCGAESAPLFQNLILGKYTIDYFHCPACDLIQTQQPYWLEEAYDSAMCVSDTGAIARNIRTARLTSSLARILGLTPASRCLDFGGGHGVFVRMMRDRGFSFKWSDAHAKNLFAVGFEGKATDTHDLLTSFEVLEHLVDVSGELDRLFSSRPAVVLLSTMLHRNDNADWWYFSPHTGQHVAFYSQRTMRHIADRFGYSFAGSRAYTLFICNDAPIASWRQRLAGRLVSKSKGNSTHPWARVIERLFPDFPSLTELDSQVLQSTRVC
jgi:hypothetical protein